MSKIGSFGVAVAAAFVGFTASAETYTLAGTDASNASAMIGTGSYGWTDSDGKTTKAHNPSAGNDYVVEGNGKTWGNLILRTPTVSDKTFGGDSLTLKGKAEIKVKVPDNGVVTIPKLIIDGEAQLVHGDGKHTKAVDGAIKVNEGAYLKIVVNYDTATDARKFDIRSSISGSGEIWSGLEDDKTAKTPFVKFSGSMADFTGKLTFQSGKNVSSEVYFYKDLPGDPAVLKEDGFTLVGKPVVKFMSSGTLGYTRGVTLSSEACEIYVEDGQTVQINGLVTGAAGFRKTGKGTLALASVSPELAGTIAVEAGTLQLCAAKESALPKATVTVSSGATLDENGPVFSGRDMLVVTGEPMTLGEVSPSYGLKRGLAVGETVACSATSVTNAEETVAAECVGYKVYTGDVVYAEGAANSFTYTHPDFETGAKLVWLWSVKRKVAVAANGAGTAAVSGDGWFVEGDPVTVTATPQRGAAFHHWEGDVPAEQAYEATLAFPMGAEPCNLTAVFSSVVYVSKDGNDSWDGSSWETAFASVERALEEGDAPYITVGEGLYEINTAIKVTKAATIVGSGNRGSVFKLASVPETGDDKRGVFYVTNAGAVLRNLAMTTGGSARGRGLYLNGGLVETCSITNCATVNGSMNGGGVWLVNGTLRDSLVADNMATSSGGYGKEGGGVYMTGGLLDHCVIRGNYVSENKKCNSGSGSGGGIRQSNGTVRNCLVVGNCARSNGTGVRISGGTLENCTIVRNGLDSLAVTGLRVDNKPTIRNTIVRGNITSSSTEDNVSLGTTPTQATLEAILTQGLDHSAVITSDPAFVDPDAGDWHIRYGACVDAGVNQDWMATATDLDGLARINGQSVDIGCYEYVPNGLACGFDVTSDGALDNANVTLNGTVIGASPEDVTFTWTVTDGFGHETVRSGKGLSVLVLPTPVGSYSVSLVVSDGVHTADATRDNAFAVYAKDIYVSPNGSADYPYVDFTTAATDLHDALAIATDGSTVHLADGVYTLKDRLIVNVGVRIEHLGRREDCVVTGGRSGTCLILLNHRDAVLSGLDVCGSYPAKYVPGSDMATPKTYICNGVRIGALGGTVTNCIVESCYVPFNGGDNVTGGGINMSAGLVIDSLIRNNAILSSGGGGSYGGGIRITGGLADRCVVTNNWTTGGSGCAGGGVRVESTGTVRNSLVAYCRSTGGGGISRTGGTVQNCTAVYNTASTSVGGIAGDANIIDCLVFNNMANGVGEDLDDPGFKDAAHGDFHLAAGSAAIDASVTEGLGELDLDGNARYQGLEELRADKGCYEFDPTVFELGIGYERQSAFYPGDVVFTASAGGASLDEAMCWWTFDGREPTAEDHDATGQTVTRTMAPGEYTVRFKTVYRETVHEVVKEDWFVLYGQTVYVNPSNANPVVPYASWETAASDINAALKCLMANATMVVSDGVYRVTSEQNLNRPLTIRSLNGPEVTSFTGARPFHVNHEDALVAGFTFDRISVWQQGIAYVNAGCVSNCVFNACECQNSGGAGIYIDGKGRAMAVDCIVRDGSTKYSKNQLGAGIHAMNANVLVDRCVVTGMYWQGANTNNAAVALEKGAVMRNSIVAYNRGGATGGVYLDGASTMENCTVVGNVAHDAAGIGGVSAGGDQACVVNTIIWANTNAVTAAVSEKGGSAAAFDTCCEEDPNFRKSRRFVWYVKNDSPCRGTAKTLDWMDGTVDVFGHARIGDGRPDIGAVESPRQPGMILIAR